MDSKPAAATPPSAVDASAPALLERMDSFIRDVVRRLEGGTERMLPPKVRERLRAFVRTLTPQRSFILVAGVGGLVLLLWASVAEIDVIVRSEGRVIPSGKSQIVQHLEGGIVRNILVFEGQTVAANQPVMELSDIRARSELGQEQSRLAALRGREARLIAESQGFKEVRFPPGLADGDVRRAETDALRARRARITQEVQVLREQSAQKRGEIAEAQTRKANLVAELDVAQQQFRVIDGLRRKGAASQMELLDSQSRVQRLSSQLSEADSSLPRLRAAQAEIESRIAEVEARFRAESMAELTQVRAELEKSSLEIDTSADRLARNVVRAPVAGMINRLAVTTIGGVVRPGETLLEITPSDERIVVEARARPNDRANLSPGLPTRIRIGAYDQAVFGTLDGRVVEVSADTLLDEREGRYYRVRIDAGQSNMRSIAPGMTATADIVVGKRTILSYLLSPLLRFRDLAFSDPR
jgi:adhesin transport system membrane fusion protein